MHSPLSGGETPSTVSWQAVVLGVGLLIAVATLPVAGSVGQATQRVAENAVAQDETHGGSTGDVIDINVSVPDGASGRLYVGSRDVAYLTSVAFTDDGDGEVTLSVNTFLAGGHRERNAWTADSGRITNVTRHTDPLPEPLEPTVYDTNLTVGGSERAVTPIPLRPASVEGVTVAAAPASEFGDEPAALTSVRTDRLAVGDTLLVQIEARGVFGLLAAQPGETTTARFRSLVTSDNASFEIRPETVDADLDIEQSFENDAIDVYTDANAGYLWVVADTSALRYEGETGGIEPGERYTVVFEIESESGLTIGEAARADEFRASERTVTFETGANGTLRLPSAADAQIAGTTAIAPGTELVVEARADGTFLRRSQTRVGGDGAFATTLNLSAVEPGTEFTASIDGLDVAIPGTVINASERGADTGDATTPDRPGPETPGSTPPSESESQTESQSTGDAAIASPVETATANRSATTTGEAGPGFGVAAAVLAVVAVAGLASRRR